MSLISQSVTVPPPIERLFQASLYLLLVAGFTTLVTTGKVDALAIVFVTGALLYRGFLIVRGREVSIPERWMSYLGVAYVAVFLLDFYFLSRDFVNAAVHLVLFVMVVKIFSIQRERDYVYLTTLAFLEILSAAILTIDTIFLGTFAAFALVAVVTFITMEMRRSARASSSSPLYGLPGNAAGFSWVVARTALFIVAGIMLCATLIFFTLPRLSYGYLSRFSRQNPLVTGFSDNINLGAIGRIQQSSQVLMHVSIDGDNEGKNQFKLRGSVLTQFDGMRWQDTAQHGDNYYGTFTATTFPIHNRPTRTPAEVLRSASGRRHHLVTYRVLMEPFGSTVVFLIDSPRAVQGRFRQLSLTPDNSARYLERDRFVSEYQGLSDIAAPSIDDLRQAQGSIPPALSQTYLQMPANLDPRISRLAHTIADAHQTPAEKAAAIDRYLSTQFGYTLELPSEMPRDPLAFFLFSRRRGHCEFFASSMAIMLREVGIPSRVVTGFRGGEFNQVSGNYIVRASDAHSWVEAYIPGAGWASYDPTPAGDAPVLSPLRKLELYADAFRQFWREWVVNYDINHQQTLAETTASTTRNRIDQLRTSVFNSYNRLQQHAKQTYESFFLKQPVRIARTIALILFALAVLFKLPGMLHYVRRIVLARNPARQPEVAAAIWYQRMTAAAKRRGYARRASQTPTEFTNTIAAEPLRSAVHKFTEQYERARFDGNLEAADSLPGLYREIEEVPR